MNTLFHSPITVFGINDLPLIKKGDDLATLICAAIQPEDGDIITIATTIVSKAKGYTRKLNEVTPGECALRITGETKEDPRLIQIVLDEAEDVIMETPFTLTALPCGHVGVRSGVDASNVEDGYAAYLPRDPMQDAEEIRSRIHQISGAKCGVILADTCGRSFRRGQTGHAIGWAGMQAIRDFRGDSDLFGRVLEITEEAVIDEIAGFANLVMGESNNGVPAVLFRGIPAWSGHDDLYFTKKEDIIRAALERK